MGGMSADPARLPPPPPPSRDWALFLDVDGTLLDLAPTPDAVYVPPGLVEDLGRMHDALGGAIALVSGRRIETLDVLFTPLRLPTIGLHGLQTRDGPVVAHAQSTDRVSVLSAATALIAKFPGALIEDKGIALALHWRNAPAAEEPLIELAHWALTLLPGYRLQRGRDVIELRPDGHDKGDAVAALLDTPAMQGRFPVFVGDDLTDEHGFDLVNARLGATVLVGNRSPSAARYGLHDPTAVRSWLHAAVEQLAPEIAA